MCIRDSLKALEKLNKEHGGVWIYNLGTGHGYSVLDVIQAFEEVNGLKINYCLLYTSRCV